MSTTTAPDTRDDWDRYHDALYAEQAANALAHWERERATLAAHLRIVTGLIGTARTVAPVTGYLSETARRLADDDLADALNRCGLLIQGLTRP